MPRCLRSLISAAAARSVSWQFCDVFLEITVLIPGFVENLDEPARPSPPCVARADRRWRMNLARLAHTSRGLPLALWKYPSTRARSLHARREFKQLMRVAISGSPTTSRCCWLRRLMESAWRVGWFRPRRAGSRDKARDRRRCGTSCLDARTAGSPAPIARARSRTFLAGAEHDERRQILRLRAQSVTAPRAHAGSPELLRAGAHQELAGRVIERVRCAWTSRWRCRPRRSRDAAKAREFRAALAVFGELELRPHQLRRRTDERRR